MQIKPSVAWAAFFVSLIVALFGSGFLKDYINRKPVDSVTFKIEKNLAIDAPMHGRIAQVFLSATITYSNHGTATSKIENPIVIVNDASATNDCNLHSGYSDVIVSQAQGDTEFAKTGILKGESVESANYKLFLYNREHDKHSPKLMLACLTIIGMDSKLNKKETVISLGRLALSPELPFKPGENPYLAEWKGDGISSSLKLY